MKRLTRRMLALILFGVLVTLPYLSGCGATRPGATSASVAQSVASCNEGLQASGALYRICMPSFPIPWNGDLVIFAHGYMPPGPPRIPEEQLALPDGTSIPGTITGMGYAFALSSYSVNGLAIREGIADTADLVRIFRAAHPALNHVYLVGASEGGLITALSVEQHPDVYSGGLATCGPIGDFRTQINYMGDFRVLFDYFFPSILPGSAISIPQTLIDNWASFFSAEVLPVIEAPASQISVTQMLSVTQALYGSLSYREVMSRTIEDVLWYNVLGTNEATTKLGGTPYDNVGRDYVGSLDDAALNAGVARYTASSVALAEIEAHYQTRGTPYVPLLTLHTTYDPVVPYRHEALFQEKVVARAMTPRHSGEDNLAEERCGHCYFTAAKVLEALLKLQARVADPPPFHVWLPIVRR